MKVDSSDSENAIRPSQTWLIGVAFFLVVAIAVGFRSIDLNRSLWLDELHTSWVVDSSVNEIPTRSLEGNQSPVYFFLVWPIVAVLGQTELALRLISFLAGIAMVIVMGWIVRRLTQAWLPALLGSLLIAIDPFFVEYSQEARPYALLQLVVLIQMYFFAKRTGCVLQTQPTDPIDQVERQQLENHRLCSRLGFILFGVLGVYIHLSAVVINASFIPSWH